MEVTKITIGEILDSNLLISRIISDCMSDLTDEQTYRLIRIAHQFPGEIDSYYELMRIKGFTQVESFKNLQIVDGVYPSITDYVIEDIRKNSCRFIYGNHSD